MQVAERDKGARSRGHHLLTSDLEDRILSNTRESQVAPKGIIIFEGNNAKGKNGGQQKSTL